MDDDSRANCWEYMRCGREPGGAKADEIGPCPASTCGELDGAHGGSMAGRSCWVVAGTARGGKPQGSFAGHRGCMRCDFYRKVIDEEMKPDRRSGFMFTTQLQRLFEESGPSQLPG